KMNHWARVFLAGAALVATQSFSPAASVVLIPTNAIWKYLDDGSNQDTGWTAKGFDDSSWKSGAARLGYGEGNEATVVSSGPDPANKYITTYFRYQLTVSSGITDARLRLLRDDG